jgi:hypothetical protein
VNSTQQTPALPPIFVPFDGSASELIAAGQRVAEFLEHPGFADLLVAIEGYRTMVDNKLAVATPVDTAAFYADAVGEKRGLGSVERIARGIVENAKRAEIAERQEEES